MKRRFISHRWTLLLWVSLRRLCSIFLLGKKIGEINYNHDRRKSYHAMIYVYTSGSLMVKNVAIVKMDWFQVPIIRPPQGQLWPRSAQHPDLLWARPCWSYKGGDHWSRFWYLKMTSIHNHNHTSIHSDFTQWHSQWLYAKLGYEFKK